MTTNNSALKTFLDRVAAIVAGDRSASYGDPTLNHMRIADLWNVWLTNRTWGPEITPYDASMMMALVKFARCQHKPMSSSHEDIAGYAAVSDFISNKLRELREVVEDDRRAGETPKNRKKQDVQPHLYPRYDWDGEKKSETDEGIRPDPDKGGG